MWDAAPVAAPTNIPPLPSGTFYFPLGPAEEATRGCLAPTLESNAWSCSVPNHVLNIEFGQNGNYPVAKISPAPQAPGWADGIHYGPQPPRVQPQQKLIWVNDLQDPGRGPALHFQTVYDKIVVIPGENFPMNQFQKRHQDPDVLEEQEHSRLGHKGAHVMLDTQPEPRHRYANNPGEEPWFCYWNATYIEGFVYIQQPIPGAETQTFAVSRYTPSHTEFSTATLSSISSSPLAAKPTVLSTASPTAITLSFPEPQGQQMFRTLLRRSGHKPAGVSSSSSSSGSEAGPSAIPSPTSPPTRFPYVIKMEERRLPNPAFHPFCQRMVALNDGTLAPKLDANGSPMIEYLKEAPGAKNDAQATAGLGNGHQRKEHLPLEGSIGHKKRYVIRQHGETEAPVSQGITRSRDEPSNGCHCQWVSPMG
jgi:hypothetical protein